MMKTFQKNVIIREHSSLRLGAFQTWKWSGQITTAVKTSDVDRIAAWEAFVTTEPTFLAFAIDVFAIVPQINIRDVLFRKLISETLISIHARLADD